MAQATKVKNEEAQGSAGVSVSMIGPLSKLGEYPRRFRQFLHEVRVEMRQVTWPTGTDVRATTAVVIITTIFFALFLFLVDLGVGRVVERVIRTFRP